MADITINAAYGSVVEDEGLLFIGFAEGEEEDEGYVLFRQPINGGPIWFEVNDEGFGAEDAIDVVVADSKGIEIVLKPGLTAKFGWASLIAVRITPATEDGVNSLAALVQMLGSIWHEQS